MSVALNSAGPNLIGTPPICSDPGYATQPITTTADQDVIFSLIGSANYIASSPNPTANSPLVKDWSKLQQRSGFTYSHLSAGTYPTISPAGAISPEWLGLYGNNGSLFLLNLALQPASGSTISTVDVATPFGTNTTSGVSSFSYSITISSLSNGLITIGVHYVSSQTLSTVTVGGVSATKSASISASTTHFEIWTLVNPGSGSKTIALTFSGNLATGNVVISGATTYSGVNQSTVTDGSSSLNPVQTGSVSLGSNSTITSKYFINPSLSNPVIYFYLLGDSSSLPPTSISFTGGTVTLVKSFQTPSGSSAKMSIYKCVNPSSGIQTLTTNWTSFPTSNSVAISYQLYSGVNQTTDNDGTLTQSKTGIGSGGGYTLNAWGVSISDNAYFSSVAIACDSSDSTGTPSFTSNSPITSLMSQSFGHNGGGSTVALYGVIASTTRGRYAFNWGVTGNIIGDSVSSISCTMPIRDANSSAAPLGPGEFLQQALTRASRW